MKLFTGDGQARLALVLNFVSFIVNVVGFAITGSVLNIVFIILCGFLSLQAARELD